MSRMFKSIDKTWNVFVGCRFNCTYCCARKQAEGRLRHSPRYKDGFSPCLIESELKRGFKPGEFIFVTFMGDIAWALQPWVEKILARIREFPQTNFLLCSKDPGCFHRWQLDIPLNVYLGTTIESNRDFGLTEAPSPKERVSQLAGYPHIAKFVSIEPIMDFDLDKLVKWIELIGPRIVEVGYDNYGNQLVEPRLTKTLELIERLERFSIVKGKMIRKAWDE